MTDQPLASLSDLQAVRAEEHPERVRSISLHRLATFPQEILRFTELEELDIGGSFREVPASLAQLKRLHTLRLRGLDLPDEILAMPSLREVHVHRVWRFLKLRPAPPLRQLLASFARSDPSHQTRMLHIALALQDDDQALARGDLREHLLALDSDVSEVRRSALRLLLRRMQDVQVPLRPGGEILFVGRSRAGRSVLSDRLSRVGMVLSQRLSSQTVAVIVGEQPRGRAVAHLDAGRPVAMEEHLRRALNQAAPGHLRGEQSTEQLAPLLTATDEGTVWLALDMMRRGGVPGGLLEELAVLTYDPDRSSRVRGLARKLFEDHAPAEAVVAMQGIVDCGVFRGRESHSEITLRVQLESLPSDAKGALDPLKLAQLLLPRGAGHAYLIDQDGAPALRALTTRLRHGILDLSPAPRRFPSVLSQLAGVRRLWMSHCDLEQLPDVVFELGELEELHLSGNRLRSVPDGMERLSQLRRLDLSWNKLHSFPSVVFRLPNLNFLDISTTRDEGARFKGLPDGFEPLQRLQHLVLKGHDLDSLPESLLRLPQLRALEVGFGRLAVLPAWLADMPALERLYIQYLKGPVAEEGQVLAVLRARGVEVHDEGTKLG